VGRLSTLAEIFSFLKRRKKAWLWIVVLSLLCMAGLITITSTVAPFIYTLF
jgi:hypothetical protein